MRAKSWSCSSRVIGKIWDIGRHGVVCRGRVWLQLRKQLRHRPWSSTYTQVHRELLYTITITIVRRLLDPFIENITDSTRRPCALVIFWFPSIRGAASRITKKKIASRSLDVRKTSVSAASCKTGNVVRINQERAAVLNRNTRKGIVNVRSVLNLILADYNLANNYH